MNTMYRAFYGQWQHPIERLSISHETKCFVVTNKGRRIAKDTDWFGIFDTAEEAKEARIAVAKRELQRAEDNVFRLRELLAKAESFDISTIEEEKA